MKKVTVFTGIFLLGTIPWVYGQHHQFLQGLAKWWEHPRVQEQLKLDNAQIEQLNTIYYRYKKQIIGLRSEAENAEVALEEALDRTNWNETEVLNLAKRRMETRNTVELKHLEMLLQMRKVLNPEQWQQLKMLKQRIKEEVGERILRKGPRTLQPPPPPHEPEEPPPPPDKF